MPRNSVAYDEDFYAWTTEQARLLRQGALSDLDIENIAEELESMGRGDKREIGSSQLDLLAVVDGFADAHVEHDLLKNRNLQSVRVTELLNQLAADLFVELRAQARNVCGLSH